MTIVQPQTADAASAPLSIDEAVGLIGAMDHDAPARDDEDDKAPGAGDAPAPEAEEPDAPAEAEATGETDETAEAEQTPVEETGPAIAPPQSWNAEGKAKWANIPRDIQELIATREAEREGALGKANQTASAAEKRAEADAQAVSQYKATLDKLIPQVEKTFQDRWASVDWSKAVDELGPAEAQKLRYQFEQETQQVRQLQAAQQAAADTQFKNYVKGQAEELKSRSPELTDPKEGPARRRAVADFLVKTGVPATELKGISAVALSLAYDAMRFRAAKTTLKTKQPAAAPTKPTVQPSATRPAAAPQKQKAAAAMDRLKTTGSINDAVAALMARN